MCLRVSACRETPGVAGGRGPAVSAGGSRPFCSAPVGQRFAPARRGRRGVNQRSGSLEGAESSHHVSYRRLPQGPARPVDQELSRLGQTRS